MLFPQVCNHIVQGIQKEAAKMREEWEHSLAILEQQQDQASDLTSTLPASGEVLHGPDLYCFELVSMVVALSGSSVGRKYLAQQHTLIRDLFSLLHTATPRIQRQVSQGFTLISFSCVLNLKTSRGTFAFWITGKFSLRIVYTSF